VRIGDELLEGSCTVSAAAMYLLRTLTEDRIGDKTRPTRPMLPCCGHSLYASEDGQSVYIDGCPYGTDWAVRHTAEGIELTTEQGQKNLVPFEEYREVVLAFADRVMAYYFQCQPKVLPEEAYDRDGYLAFWREWARRRGIAAEDTPIGGFIS
jgi:hypothetical protein